MTQGTLFRPSLRWPAGPRLERSIPCHPVAFRYVWTVLDGRVQARGYVGSPVESFSRRFMAWEMELGDRVAMKL